MSTRRICIVDDDPSVRDALAITLTDAGCEVNTAPDVESGLAVMRSQRHDALITDLQMPGIGDCAVVTRFRRAFPDIPIIAVSGNETLGPVALALGAAAFIPKPCRAGLLVECIERLCAQRQVPPSRSK